MIPNQYDSYNYNHPNQDASLNNITATGDVNINVKGGKVGNITSTEGSVKIVMSGGGTLGNISSRQGNNISSIDPSTPQYILDFLNNRGRSVGTPKASTVPSNDPVRQETTAKQLNAQPNDTNIVGKITRCAQCGLFSTSMKGGKKIGPTSTSPSGTIITDPANKQHIISGNGIYQLVQEGPSQYRIERISDHQH